MQKPTIVLVTDTLEVFTPCPSALPVRRAIFRGTARYARQHLPRLTAAVPTPNGWLSVDGLKSKRTKKKSHHTHILQLSNPLQLSNVITSSSSSYRSLLFSKLSETHLCRVCKIILPTFYQATTDLKNTCTTSHTGTSASAPLAAGIIALALQVKWAYNTVI